MKQIGIDRLIKLANHLEGTKFDSSTFYRENDFELTSSALDHAPDLWPVSWEISYGQPILKLMKYDEEETRKSAMEWFYISENEYDILFFPNSLYQFSNKELINKKEMHGLNEYAIAKDVAANIKKFINMKKTGINRLIKLVDYLEIHNYKNTVCVLRYAPILWPESWELVFESIYYNDEPRLKSCNNIYESAIEWFYISQDEFNILFMPSEFVKLGNQELINCKYMCSLNKDATAKDVEANLKKFIKLKYN